jgi:hypothetical protein
MKQFLFPQSQLPPMDEILVMRVGEKFRENGIDSWDGMPYPDKWNSVAEMHATASSTGIALEQVVDHVIEGIKVAD